MSEIRRLFNKLLKLLSAAEELADQIALEMERYAGQLGLEAQPTRNGHRAASRSRIIFNQILKMAEPKATTLEIHRRSDGGAEIRIDDGKQFSLPPMLADLLSALALESGHINDELVGWKSIDELLFQLGKKKGSKVTRRALIENIYRLRKELLAHGELYPLLVQTNRRYGARFALLRKPQSIPTASGVDQSVVKQADL